MQLKRRKKEALKAPAPESFLQRNRTLSHIDIIYVADNEINRNKQIG